jgi:hypothetical protein
MRDKATRAALCALLVAAAGCKNSPAGDEARAEASEGASRPGQARVIVAVLDESRSRRQAMPDRCGSLLAMAREELEGRAPRAVELTAFGTGDGEGPRALLLRERWERPRRRAMGPSAQGEPLEAWLERLGRRCEAQRSSGSKHSALARAVRAGAEELNARCQGGRCEAARLLVLSDLREEEDKRVVRRARGLKVEGAPSPMALPAEASVRVCGLEETKGTPRASLSRLKEAWSAEVFGASAPSFWEPMCPQGRAQEVR